MDWCSVENQKGVVTIEQCSVENQKGVVTIEQCSVENQKGVVTIEQCSVENQKGVVTIEQCSVENQKGAITEREEGVDSNCVYMHLRTFFLRWQNHHDYSITCINWSLFRLYIQTNSLNWGHIDRRLTNQLFPSRLEILIVFSFWGSHMGLLLLRYQKDSPKSR